MQHKDDVYRLFTQWTISLCLKTHNSFQVQESSLSRHLAVRSRHLYHVHWAVTHFVSTFESRGTSWLPVSRWPITLECLNPLTCEACLLPRRPPLLDALNWNHVGPTPNRVSEPEPSAAASCSVNKWYFSKECSASCGGFVSVAGTLLRYKLKRVPFKGLFIVNSRARTYTPTQNQGTTAIIKRTNCQAGGGTESKVQKSRKLSELWEWQLDMSQCWIVWKELRHLTAVQELQGCGPPACCHLRQH